MFFLIWNFLVCILFLRRAVVVCALAHSVYAFFIYLYCLHHICDILLRILVSTILSSILNPHNCMCTNDPQMEPDTRAGLSTIIGDSCKLYCWSDDKRKQRCWRIKEKSFLFYLTLITWPQAFQFTISANCNYRQNNYCTDIQSGLSPFASKCNQARQEQSAYLKKLNGVAVIFEGKKKVERKTKLKSELSGSLWSEGTVD